MKLDIKNCFTGGVQFTAEIDCAEDAEMSLKVGLAVKWAIDNKADLTNADLAGADLAYVNLARANLTDADLADVDLAGADLAGADLTNADLAGANLAGADLAGADLTRTNLADAGTDARGYRFWAWRHKDGHVVYRGGCREWHSYEDAVAHYGEGYNSDGHAPTCLAKLAALKADAEGRGWMEDLRKICAAKIWKVLKEPWIITTYAKTPALALCIAALKVRTTTTSSEDRDE